ncbi:hypothetical protein P389DRAFT_192724 [Cystobasidium minutum MCA 4210]|uniref:uncharacterized protein n=1 Tax=Cystobasidium minutum MCA 4210 TaxID=1397322 RepID=UPI0034CEAA3C|eukprot:jgi/Rhomi1/192724/gm1.938_g
MPSDSEDSWPPGTVVPITSGPHKGRFLTGRYTVTELSEGLLDDYVKQAKYGPKVNNKRYLYVSDHPVVCKEYFQPDKLPSSALPWAPGKLPLDLRPVDEGLVQAVQTDASDFRHFFSPATAKDFKPRVFLSVTYKCIIVYHCGVRDAISGCTEQNKFAWRMEENFARTLSKDNDTPSTLYGGTAFEVLYRADLKVRISHQQPNGRYKGSKDMTPERGNALLHAHTPSWVYSAVPRVFGGDTSVPSGGGVSHTLVTMLLLPNFLALYSPVKGPPYWLHDRGKWPPRTPGPLPIGRAQQRVSSPVPDVPKLGSLKESQNDSGHRVGPHKRDVASAPPKPIQTPAANDRNQMVTQSQSRAPMTHRSGPNRSGPGRDYPGNNHQHSRHNPRGYGGSRQHNERRGDGRERLRTEASRTSGISKPPRAGRNRDDVRRDDYRANHRIYRRHDDNHRSHRSGGERDNNGDSHRSDGKRNDPDSNKIAEVRPQTGPGSSGTSGRPAQRDQPR